LLEIDTLCDTLIADADGVYDPSSYSDPSVALIEADDVGG
jgi:hypothetical protein